MSKRIRVEVAYALPERQEIISLEVEHGSTIQEVINASAILSRFPDIDLTRQAVGVFSKKRALTDVVGEGDRIEIYRPLTIDPKELRRVKAKRKVKK